MACLEAIYGGSSVRARDKRKFVTERELQKAIEKVRSERWRAKDEDSWVAFCTKEIERYNANAPNLFTENFGDFENEPKHAVDKNNEERFICNMQKSFENIQPEIILPCSAQRKTSGRTEKDKLLIMIEREKDDLLGCLIKIKHVLEIIEHHIFDFRKADADKEGLQLEQKAYEFCARFSRNHLYQTEFQLQNITEYQIKQVGNESNQAQHKHLKLITNYFQDVLKAYTMLQRSMRVVWRYDATIQKLQKLIDITMKSFELLTFPKPSQLDDLRDLCVRVSGVLKHLDRVKFPYIRTQSKEPSKPTKRVIRSAQENKKDKCRFSMYHEKPIDGNCKICVPNIRHNKFLSRPNSGPSKGENSVGQRVETDKRCIDSIVKKFERSIDRFIVDEIIDFSNFL